MTIFGQSGGGGKVTSLMQTPAADGLFHKAIIMSGIADGRGLMNSKNTDSRPLIQAMLNELGLTEAQVEQLETLPYETLAEAYKKVVPAIREAGGYTGCGPIPNSYYLGDPWDIGFTEHAQTIPLIAGTVVAEFGGMAPSLKNRTTMSEKEQLDFLRQYLGEYAEPLAKLFAQCYPDRPVTDLVLSDTFSRVATKNYVKMKAAQSQVPTYNYVFLISSPLTMAGGMALL